MKTANPELTTYLADLPWQTQPRGTMSQLARTCGVAEATVYKWQKGMTAPSSQYWGHIETLFDLKPGTIAQLAAASPAELTRSQRQALADTATTIEREAQRLAALAAQLRKDIATSF